MHRNKLKQAVIHDYQANNCTAEMIEVVLDIFESVMKSMHLARHATYDLADFWHSKERGINKYTLQIERKQVYEQEQWWGTFTDGNSSLFVMGALERV